MQDQNNQSAVDLNAPPAAPATGDQQGSTWTPPAGGTPTVPVVPGVETPATETPPKPEDGQPGGQTPPVVPPTV